MPANKLAYIVNIGTKRAPKICQETIVLEVILRRKLLVQMSIKFQFVLKLCETFAFGILEYAVV